MKKILLLISLLSAALNISFAGICSFICVQDSANPLLIHINYYGTPGISYSYDFGDSTGTSTLQSPDYQYADTGLYFVTLNTIDTSGIACTYTAMAQIRSNVDCNFYVPLITVLGNSVTFTDMTTGGVVAGYQWNFGDGSPVDTAQNPSHVFSLLGFHTVTLTTTDLLGITCMIWQDVQVLPAGSAQCGFTGDSTGVVGQPVNFIDTTIGQVVNYRWDFGDGDSSALQNPSHIYAAQGYFTVSLRTIDTFGQMCSTSRVVAIGPPGGICNFSLADTIWVGLAGNFMPHTTLPSLNFQWDFGDGSVSSLRFPMHAYANVGTYTVCLTTTDQVSGQTCTLCKNILVLPNCFAGFQYASTGLSTLFVENSYLPLSTQVNYNWNFGDGYTSTLRYPLHNYSTSGSYIACLIISDTSSCFDTLCQMVTVDTILPDTCSAYFMYTQSQPSVVDVVNASHGESPSYLWDFGDGTTSGATYPTHVYSTIGSYIICLTVNDTTGCTSTFCDSIHVDTMGLVSGFASSSGFTINVISPQSLVSVGPMPEFTDEDFIYPNPAHDRIHIVINNEIIESKFELRTFTGAVVKKGFLFKGTNSIDLKDLREGVYIINYSGSNGIMKSKMIVRM